ncbi:MAG: Na+/H+ antiporter NhaA [Gammaproteobacteria bacterium]|nr:Na+/H+ antiporter NhaA [Gammaproteobacteria bacterium]
MPVRSLKRFIQSTEGTGILLFFILCAALLTANSSFYPLYQHFIALPARVGWGEFNLTKPMLAWINDGLMAIFFMGLALEIKEEMLVGALSAPTKALLPCVGALGGITVPALIYLGLTHAHPILQAGWPIPTATDVALSLAAAAALGKRVPNSLKVFLLALAIVDDVAAIVMIALMYTHELSLVSIALALLGVIFLLLLSLAKVRNLAAYLLVGLLIWLCVLRSGVHATLAGVMVGFIIPFGDKDTSSPLVSLKKALQPWINYLILPLFVFFNGGLHFESASLNALFSPLSLGIVLGLCVGKTLGIFSATYLCIKFKIAPKLHEADTLQLLGISALGGIGFTMSLFLASLAFHVPYYETLCRQSVLLGSTLALLAGTMIFVFSARGRVN